MNSFKINKLSSLGYDTDTMNADTAESIGPGEYQLTRHSKKQEKNFLKTALSEQAINFNTGTGFNMKNTEKYVPPKVSVHKGDCNQLFTRPFLTIPYLGKGELNVDSESNLKSGDNSRTTKTCNNLSGLDMTQYHMIPLVKNIKDNIQKPIHYIPELNDPCWSRGGLDTNQIKLDNDYFGRCIDSHVPFGKETVSNYLYKRKKYPCNIPEYLN